MAMTTVVGAGSWGTALAQVLVQNGRSVRLWARRGELVREIVEQGENRRYLPGVRLDPEIEVLSNLSAAVRGSDLVVFAIPSQSFREVLREAIPYLPSGAVIVNVAKGIEERSQLRLSQVYSEESGDTRHNRYAALSGPSHAEEVGLGLPTAIVASSPHPGTAEIVQDAFMSPKLRVYTNPDLTGVELGGALKNIIALGTGIAEGLGFGDNTKAAIMTRGLTEITRLGTRLGADPLTFGGLAGVGDLIVTCTSMHSRNRRAGIAIGKGLTVSDAERSVNMVVEGVRTTRAAHGLSTKLDVVMPITTEIYRVLFENVSPKEAVGNLMTRSRTREIEEVARISVSWTERD
ncbi:MAG: NAD(P)H-dependent glycerol-3-phosphate dehydrogenase [Eubacteriales bacterium]|jgi:glycerol-3-phosphate dehydrogenase (NAD(P)+)|nr:NAD(P)H-dependent glycerol-3-phosphate dehydrogenase [Bacillota bacterium]MBV1727807.1 NAD(P)H-dependent glycerol-3-phosphate dehydrogenase [Desulforudis sp.]MDQ7788449.1 NAD(P)H-dependent glycerol-3-phosphate dehydrogenase [Clostridia bacterium]MDZ4042139.1 NAD(P)H-dependent glycerol-3-phosphate dehydrogenase [Eubacteriales bacterium]MBU4532416.1 NAD(P)H-dependent glycerol-3-phosphate dehydrogenase [Bacillota bacterium]